MSGDRLHVQRVELADSLIELSGRFECFGAQPTRARAQRWRDLLVGEEFVHPGERVGALTIAQRHLGVLELQVEAGGRVGVVAAVQHLRAAAKLLGQCVDRGGTGDALVRLDQGHVARGDSVGGQVGLGKVRGVPKAAQSLPERLPDDSRESFVPPLSGSLAATDSCCVVMLIVTHASTGEPGGLRSGLAAGLPPPALRCFLSGWSTRCRLMFRRFASSRFDDSGCSSRRLSSAASRFAVTCITCSCRSARSWAQARARSRGSVGHRSRLQRGIHDVTNPCCDLGPEEVRLRGGRIRRRLTDAHPLIHSGWARRRGGAGSQRRPA